MKLTQNPITFNSTQNGKQNNTYINNTEDHAQRYAQVEEALNANN